MSKEKEIVENVYIARQPILDVNSKIFAYEILYRENRLYNFYNTDLDNFNATAKVLSLILNNIGTEKIIDNKKGMINVDKTILDSEIIENIPKENFYLEILESCEITDDFIKRVDQLLEQGYKFILDDFRLTRDHVSKYKPIFSKVKFIKADFSKNSFDNMEKIVKVLSKYNVNFLAEKVETVTDFEKLKQMGYSYFQGYYFSKPMIFSSKKIDPLKNEITSVLSILYNNSNIDTIAKRFENCPLLTLNLLKFLNSSFFSFRNPIKSIRQSITMLGVNKLKKWLTLLLYTSVEGDINSNPLFNLIKNRSDFMLNIAKNIKDKHNLDEEIFYLTGLLSKIDVAMNTPLEKALDDLKIDDSLKKYIINKEGIPGKVLELAEANEEGDIENINQILKELNLTTKDLTVANITSYQTKIS